MQKSYGLQYPHTLIYGGKLEYATDQAHMLQKINSSINTIENSSCLLLCDFKFIKIDWSKGEGNGQPESSFIDTLNDHFLVQMVDKPTKGNNILDLVCISDPSCIDKLEVEESFALSDHVCIKALLRCPVV